MTVEETVVARLLRRYYNEVMENEEQLQEEEINLSESERALILLDEKYAEMIVKALKVKP